MHSISRWGQGLTGLAAVFSTPVLAHEAAVHAPGVVHDASGGHSGAAFLVAGVAVAAIAFLAREFYRRRSAR